MSLVGRARAWFGARLPPDLEGPFGAEIAEQNRRRLVVLLPIMVVGHAIHVFVFRPSASERSTLRPLVAHFRDAIAVMHAVTLLLGVALLGLVVASRKSRGRLFTLAGPLTGVAYLLHGAAAASLDQLIVTGVTPFVGYCLGTAVVVVLRPATMVVIYGVATLAFVSGIAAMQPSASVRLAELPNGISMVVVSVTLGWMLYAAKRRDFVQRLTIEKQGRELAELNAQLEQRVNEQVFEIRRRAEEVELLNAQLRTQIQARSDELSLALSKLGQKRGVDGRLRRGSVFAEQFEIQNLVGEGGMGSVYSGIDRITGAEVAVKVIQASSARHLVALRRFLSEAKAAATVTHPAIVRMLHVDVSDDGILFQVQELVGGATLAARLAAQPKWEPGAVGRLGAVLADALAAAHAKGIVHRDVKPSNMMLTRTAPGLKLLDFGIAKLYADADSGESNGTRTGAVLGTPGFMGPEHMLGSRHVTDRSDVFAMGVVLFVLLTGRHPFDEAEPRRLTRQDVLAASDPRSIERAIPDGLASIVSSCLRHDAGERPAAVELAVALRAFADGQGAAPLHELWSDAPATENDAATQEEQRLVSSRPSPPDPTLRES